MALWFTIARILIKRFVKYVNNSMRCTLCGCEIRANTLLNFYAVVYKHFRSVHPDVLEYYRCRITLAYYIDRGYSTIDLKSVSRMTKRDFNKLMGIARELSEIPDIELRGNVIVIKGEEARKMAKMYLTDGVAVLTELS